MANGLSGLTVRRFSKTTVAREFLKAKFKFEAIFRPDLSPLKTDAHIPANLLGTTFDYVLLLLIERCNPDFTFALSLSENLINGRSKLGRPVKEYFKTGILSDLLVDELILYGETRQKSFQQTSKPNNLIIPDSLRNELRRMHLLATKVDWNIKKSFQQGWLTGGRFMNARPDLILDDRLLEVKSVKNAEDHGEYLSQLFCYYLMSQCSSEQHLLSLDELGLYYARHGVLTKNKIAEVIRFPLAHLKRVVFDFDVAFQYWRNGVHPLQTNPQIPVAELEKRRWMSFNDALSSIHPKPNWLEKALEKRFKRTKQGLVPQQIKIPTDFLIS